MHEYRQQLYSNYSTNFGEMKIVDDQVRWRRYRMHYDFSGLPRDAVIADLGCGRGEWLAWLHSQGFTNLTGIDYTDEAASREFKGAKYTHIRGDVVEEIGKQESAFDMMSTHDMVEHLTKDEMVDFLLRAKKALKPGGQLWISTFNGQAIMSAAIYRGDFTHETAFSPMSMYQALAACGFKDVTVKTVDVAMRGSLGGTLRWVSEKLLDCVGKWAIKTRSGRYATPPGVEAFGVRGRLIACAHRPE